jgi:hypothetical protein
MARKQATAAEAQALKTVYQKLSDLLDALRDARAQIHHEALQELINTQIDRQLEAEEQLRTAFVDYTGQPVQEGY